MHFNWSIFFTALGLAFVFEGMFYFLGAERVPRILRILSERPPSDLRKLGLTAIILGLLIVFLARSG